MLPGAVAGWGCGCLGLGVLVWGWECLRLWLLVGVAVAGWGCLGLGLLVGGCPLPWSLWKTTMVCEACLVSSSALSSRPTTWSM